MIVFNANITYGLLGFKTFFESNYSRSNNIASQICDVLRSTKILRKCLIQQIKAIDESVFTHAFDYDLNNKNWCKWTKRKTCT